jgi:hypothetical protein
VWWFLARRSNYDPLLFFVDVIKDPVLADSQFAHRFFVLPRGLEPDEHLLVQLGDVLRLRDGGPGGALRVTGWFRSA